MIVTVGGIKGGSGKTTIATHLAILRTQDDLDVLLIDADDQETSFDFSILRDEQQETSGKYTYIKLSGKAVRTETIKQAEKYDDIIIDTGGRDTSSQRAAMTIADVFLIPFVPRSFDLWTLQPLSNLVEEIKTINPNLKVYAFLNRADFRGSDNDEAIKYIKDCQNIQFLDVCISNRKAFGNAAAEGKAVNEIKNKDLKAVEEIKELYNSVFDCEEDFVTKGANEVA
jgi:chromosome partitioning protein